MKKIISYLLVGLPETDLGNNAEATLKIWENVLEVFPYHIAEEAAKQYLRNFKRFSAISDLIKICDEVWQKDERLKREENEQAERDATHLLFTEPLDKIDRSMGRIAKLSVALVRDVCNGEIKYRSPEWNQRQLEFEELAGVVSYVYD